MRCLDEVRRWRQRSLLVRSELCAGELCFGRPVRGLQLIPLLPDLVVHVLHSLELGLGPLEFSLALAEPLGIRLLQRPIMPD